MSAAMDRALTADTYEPKELAVVISAHGSESLRRMTEGWIRTVLREGFRSEPPANAHLLIAKRDARWIWVYADEWYNRVNRPRYDAWLDANHHHRPKLIYKPTRALVTAGAIRRPAAPQPEASVTPSLVAAIEKIFDERFERAMKALSPAKPRKQITDGNIISYVSPLRRRAKKLVDSFVNRRSMTEGRQPSAEDHRDTWVWLRCEFEQAVGGIDEAVYRGQLEGESWLGGIEAAGYLELFVSYLPKMLANLDSGYPKQEGLFR